MEVRELEIGSRLYDEVLELRFELFFQQHNLPREILVDEHERVSRHIAIVNGELLIAYGRVTGLGEGICQLSQIVVNSHEQGKGYGTMILKELVEQAEKDGGKRIILNARTTATNLYKKHRFKVNGGVFLSKNTGVPHVQMVRTQTHL